ncbi:MAG: tetratricopeptide repeat protein [Chloroflexota bacterium]
MATFNELLNQYVQRLGISDTELARSIGVSRQTIFRWREGQTGRPRRRDDVLVIANKLRLTPEERDRLLLAAGFHPVGDEPGRIEAAEQGSGAPAAAELARNVPAAESAPPLPAASSPDKRWASAAVVGLLLVLAGAGWWLARGQTQPQPTASPTGRIISTPLSLPTPSPATEGETLVLVTHFANYASSQVGYNVAGRLAEALQSEVAEARLQNIRIAIWPEAVGERETALQTGQVMSATLVIYGEYDVGRVVVKFAHPARRQDFVDPALQQQVLDVQDLSTAINSDLPQQVRSLALLALGQISLNRGEMDQARSLLLQARRHLLANPQTEAVLDFYLGVAYHHSDPPALAEAIAAYSAAIDAWPELLSSRLNRIAAYEDRQQPGDLALALADAEALVAADPTWALAYNNRASIRWASGGAENLELALDDLAQALALDPTLPEAYFNRAQIRFQQGLPMAQVAPDLFTALDLRPDYGNVLNLLCWGYAVEQQPAQAMPYCQQAVALGPEPEFVDSRGLAYALRGEYAAAIADFQTYIDRLAQQPGELNRAEVTRRRAWIAALQAGHNPFTPQLLAQLRREFGP